MGTMINKEEKTMSDHNRYKGYHVDDLREVFDTVCDPEDWKAPIAITAIGEHVLPIVTAIEFFTATAPNVSLDTGRMRYLIESKGYRNGPAGP
jgi:hypothetical protein